jgi:hypothetical protein
MLNCCAHSCLSYWASKAQQLWCLQVIRASTGGVLIYLDTVSDPSMMQDAWAQWMAWQAERWMKSLQVIRPLNAMRLMLHEPHAMLKVLTWHV